MWKFEARIFFVTLCQHIVAHEATHVVTCLGNFSGRNRTHDGRSHADRMREVCGSLGIHHTGWDVSDGISRAKLYVLALMQVLSDNRNISTLNASLTS